MGTASLQRSEHGPPTVQEIRPRRDRSPRSRQKSERDVPTRANASRHLLQLLAASGVHQVAKLGENRRIEVLTASNDRDQIRTILRCAVGSPIGTDRRRKLQRHRPFDRGNQDPVTLRLDAHRVALEDSLKQRMIRSDHIDPLGIDRPMPSASLARKTHVMDEVLHGQLREPGLQRPHRPGDLSAVDDDIHGDRRAGDPVR